MSINTQVAIGSEDLSKLARFAFDQADALCSAEHGCNPYHKAWSFLRLFERGGALPAGEAFYRRELESVVARGGKRVLLSGAADTGLMALVIKVFAEFGITPDVALVDRCGTVIEQNRLFAETMKLNANYFIGDIHDYSAEPFDVIFAHSFMLFFPKNQLSALASSWRRLLKTDGIVLSTDFLTTSSEPVHINAIPEAEIDERLASITKAAEAHGMETSSITPNSQGALVYFLPTCILFRRRRLSQSELRNSMRNGGLDMVRSSTGAVNRVYSNYGDQRTDYFSTVLAALD